MQLLNKPISRLVKRIEPQITIVKAKWRQLQPREQQLVVAMVAFISFVILYSAVTGLIKLKNNVVTQVNNLSQFTVYSQQAAATYKVVKKIEANSFNTVSSDQIKGDITQVLQIKDPDILIQNGQLTINVPNAQFSQVMILLDQLRKSYALFPGQVSITRQTQSGFVSFSATFWVKQ